MDEMKGDENVMRMLRRQLVMIVTEVLRSSLCDSPQDQSGKGEGEEQDDVPAIWHPARKRTVIHGEGRGGASTSTNGLVTG